MNGGFRAQQQDGPQPPRDAPSMPGPSGAGAADPLQSRRKLQAAAERKERDADHPTGKAGGLSSSGRGTRCPPDVLPGTDYRSSTRRTAGTPLDRPGHQGEMPDGFKIRCQGGKESFG